MRCDNMYLTLGMGRKRHGRPNAYQPYKRHRLGAGRTFALLFQATEIREEPGRAGNTRRSERKARHIYR